MYKNEDEFLDELIRRAKMDSESEPVRPDNDAITAYTMGYASKSQEQQIKQAMIESAEFRREILELINELDNIDPQAINNRASEISEDKARAHIKKILKSDPGPTLAPSFWDKLKSVLTWKVYVPVTAAVLTYLFVFLPMLTAPRMQLVVKSVEKGLLIGSSLKRSGSAADTVTNMYKDDQEAALAGFKEVLKLEDKDFEFDLQYQNPPVPENGYPVRLILTKENESIIHEVQTIFANIDGKPPAKIKAWILSMPSLDLWSINIKKPKTKITWKDEYGRMGCITFTFAVDNIFRHGEVFTFKFD